MDSIDERIKEVEDEILRTPHHKATEHHIGTLRGKLAKLREERIKKSAKKKGEGYSIKKQGHRTVVIVGFPSVGKSTLLNKLTNAESKVAAYDFTTVIAIPGMMDYKQTRIQFIDLPGVIKEASRGKGGGKQIINMVRNADLIVIMLDSQRTDRLRTVREELHGAGIRLDQKQPQIVVKKKHKGGLNISTARKLTKTTMETIRGVFREFRIPSADVVIKENVTEEQVIDSILGNRHYVPSLVVVNKCDVKKPRMKNAALISAEKGTGLAELKEKIWQSLDVVRVYMKEPGKEADLKEPLIMRKGCTVKNVARKIKMKSFRYAKIWGASARFKGQKAGETHVLKDKDVISFY